MFVSLYLSFSSGAEVVVRLDSLHRGEALEFESCVVNFSLSTAEDPFISFASSSAVQCIDIRVFFTLSHKMEISLKLILFYFKIIWEKIMLQCIME